MLDQRHFRRDHIGETAGRYTDRMLAKLLLHPANQSVDQPDVSVIETGLHRADSASADHLAWLSHVDARQAGRALKQRVGGNLHAGTNHAAEILASGRHRIERRRRSKIDDDERYVPLDAVNLIGGDRVDDAVGADFRGMLVKERHARVHAAVDVQRRQAEIAPGHRHDGAGERRHHRAQHDAVDAIRIQRAMLEQLRYPDADFVRRALAQRGEAPAFDERAPLEDTEHDVRVADVNR